MRITSFAFPLAMLGLLCAFGASVQADEFTTLAPADPAYASLKLLTRAPTGSAPVAPDAALTRYEAALETARAYFLLNGQNSGDSRPLVTREKARALRQLVLELRPELRELDLDTDAVLAFCANLGRAPISQPINSGAVRALPSSSSGFPAGDGFSWATPISGTSPFGGEYREFATSPRRLGASSELSASLSSRLRVGTALLALQRDASDPFGDAQSVGVGLGAHSAAGRALGGSAAVAYDFSPWLSMHLAGSQNDVSAARTAASSPFSAPIFANATRAVATGGGLDIAVKGLRFSTDLESLSGDTGYLGTSVGGGVGLNAWQNRLSLSAHLARLQPADSDVLASTAAELHMGVDVTRRLNLSLLYQGLFTDQSQSGASRIAGGINLSF